MFRRKKAESPAIDKAVTQGVSFEVSLADRAKRSEKRAWMVACCATLMSLVLAGGYLLFLPLKEKVPYLVIADPYSGTASVARLSGNFGERDVTAEEAINKSNVAQFIMARESYDSGLVGQRNWRTTLSMAGQSVAPAYTALHAETNFERPFRLYGASKALNIRILSIVLVGAGQGKRPTGATVRFQRSVYEKARGRADPLDNRIATMEFSYDPSLRLNDEDRLLNPLGFRVLNYRVDNDFAGTPAPPAHRQPVALPQAAQEGYPAGAAVMDSAGYPQVGTGPDPLTVDPSAAALPPLPTEQFGGMGEQRGVER